MTQQPLFWVYTQKFGNIYSQKHMHPYVHCNIIYSGQDMETTECPSITIAYRCVHIYSGVLLSNKKR